MPGNLHFFDTTLPRAADANGKSAEEQLSGIYNYLYMLLEQLRYTLSNLDGSNINAAALSGFQKLITEPINVRLEDAEGNIHTLTITASELSSRISAEVQRAGGVEQSLYSSILQTASAIAAEVSRATIAEGALDVRATKIEQTADDLTLKITVNGGVTTYSFEANGVQIGNSMRQVELYSLTGELPPVGVVGGVYVNVLGQNVLEHGWYAAYDSSWTGQNAVYCCATYNGGVSWGAVYIKSGVAGRQGYDGLAVVLNNNPHVFAGSESAAVASQAQVGVIAFLGSVRQAVTINSVTGAPTGMSYTVAGNGTQNARVIVSVTTALTQKSGELSVNVTVGQQTFTLPWSWSVAYKGVKGEDGYTPVKGVDYFDGTNGTDGKDGEPIEWQGSFPSAPANPKKNWAYYNTTAKASYVFNGDGWYQMSIDGVDGINGTDGKDGLSIVWKGERSTPPQNPSENWAYRDTDDGLVYIFHDGGWELMVADGNDGAEGAAGADGLSVYITYNDSESTPATPTGDGTTGGWHTNATSAVVWMSQKVAESASAGTWGTPIKIHGKDGTNGRDGRDGSDASVTFNNINNALAGLFVKLQSGTPMHVSDYELYSPIIEAAEIFASKIYAGEGSGFSKMSATGLDVYTAGGAKKIGMGYNTTNDTDYPYIMLGQGTGYSGGGAAIVQKLGAGIWIGDDSIVAAGGSYPGNRNSAQDISGSYPHATGLFVDFSGDTIHHYVNGVPGFFIPPNSYGASLPAPGNPGRIFFKTAT